eukprot:gene10609-8079_t
MAAAAAQAGGAGAGVDNYSLPSACTQLGWRIPAGYDFARP